MKKKILFTTLFVFFLLFSNLQAQKPAKILMLIASTNFRDEEYFIPKKYFQAYNNIVITASTKLTTIKGMLGKTTRPDILISEINPDDFDAIVLPGGVGVVEFWTNTEVLTILKTFHNQKKIIAAECLSPMTLAKAGILKNKKITSFISIKYDIQKYNCIYTGQSITIDKNIITSKGPKGAQKFAKITLQKINKNLK